jgi:N-methylhydantoinase B
VFEEGIQIPIMKLVQKGRLNDDLMDIILKNVRLPEMVRGDLMANIACNEVGCRALVDFMNDYGIKDLRDLADAITGHSDALMRAQIRAIPDGVYRNSIQVEGPDEPVTLAAALTVSGDHIHLDFAGTGSVVKRGVNVPLCYTQAFTFYALKCLLIPDIPNNDGCMGAITLSAPDNCILNALSPWPTGGRNIFGHFVAPLINGALRDVLPSRVPADTGMVALLNCQGFHEDGRRISTIFFTTGGYGALEDFDGHAVTPAPSNMIGSPTEVFEQHTSIRVVSRRLLPDSGGAGKHPGGPGQETVLRNDTGQPLQVSCFAARTQFPAQGIGGGANGSLRRHIINGKVVDSKGRYMLHPGDTLTLIDPGGAGFGDPKNRPAAQLVEDVQGGHRTVQGVMRDFGVDLMRGTAAKVLTARGAMEKSA